MEYIREALLRQRSAWARLLMGREEQGEQTGERPMAAGGSGALEGRDSGGGAEMPRTGMRGGFGGGPEAEPLLRGGGFDGGMRATRSVGGDGSGGPSEKKRHEEDSRLDGRALTAAAFGRDSGSGERYVYGGAEGGPVDPRARQVTELVWTGGGETADPEAVSRAFQRDARRYDGGFALY